MVQSGMARYGKCQAPSSTDEKTISEDEIVYLKVTNRSSHLFLHSFCFLCKLVFSMVYSNTHACITSLFLSNMKRQDSFCDDVRPPSPRMSRVIEHPSLSPVREEVLSPGYKVIFNFFFLYI